MVGGERRDGEGRLRGFLFGMIYRIQVSQLVIGLATEFVHSNPMGF
jgi:hypothetical protein